MTDKKPPISKADRAANSRKGAKKSPWSKWQPGAFTKKGKDRVSINGK